MVEILSKICRICLAVLKNNDFLTIDKFRNEQLRFIKVELNLSLTENPVICTTCANKLEQSFNIKTKLLNNFSFLNDFKTKENPLINIEDFVTRPAFTEGVKLEVEKVCLICLRYFEIDNLTTLDALKDDWCYQKDIFEKCLPEVDFTLVNEPFFCNNCLESLQNLFNIVLAFITSEEFFNGYANPENDGLKKIDLQKVSELNVLNDDSEIKCDTDVLDIKEEIVALSPYPDVKIEDEEHMENEEHMEATELLGTDCIHKRFIKKTHQCPYCSYTNNKRANLSSHLIVHENLSDNTNFKKYRCDMCCFNSKWRSSLMTHKLLHKKSPELTIFKCYNCSYETIYKKHLRRHMKLHQFKMYFCDACPYKTKKPVRLEMHKCKPKPAPEEPILVKIESKDSGIKSDPIELVQMGSDDGNTTINEEYQPDEIYSYFSKIIDIDHWYYLCNSCKYTTIKMSRIKEHVMKHQQKREEKCPLCEYRYKHKKSLKIHMKQVHK